MSDAKPHDIDGFASDCLTDSASPVTQKRAPRQVAAAVVGQATPEQKMWRAFERVSAKLKTRVGAEAYASWFGRLKLAEYSKSQICLSVPTAFLRSWIHNHYAALLTELWQQENPEILRVEIVVRGVRRITKAEAAGSRYNDDAQLDKPQTTADPLPPMTEAKSAPTPVLPSVPPPAVGETFDAAKGGSWGSPLDPRYRFDNFVEGSANRVALAAARSIAELGHGGTLRFNPLFIHAGVGLGKTHLLQAVASAALKRLSPARVVYLTAEYFMWRFAAAIRDNNALSFKEQLREIDLLIIDDMQFLQGKSIQNEFCHLLNTLLDSAKQVIVAADRPPVELESLDPRVRSRLQGGVSLEISAPDYEMRLAMLRQRLQLARMEEPDLRLDERILTHIAEVITGSGRDLEGAFNQLLFRQSFEPDLSQERIDALLMSLTRANETKRIRIEDIQRIVARHYNVSRQDMLSNRRTRIIVRPRQVAMYLAKTLTSRSLPEIGRRFGGRDHTTVLHAMRKVEDMVGNDQKLAQEMELLKRLIHEQAG